MYMQQIIKYYFFYKIIVYFSIKCYYIYVTKPLGTIGGQKMKKFLFFLLFGFFFIITLGIVNFEKKEIIPEKKHLKKLYPAFHIGR